MTCAYVSTACLHHGEVVPVQIETDIQPGLPHFSIIGLPDKQIEEAKERVRAAIRNAGFTFPLGRITVNLSPSYVAKNGTGFDLGIALGILQANRVLPALSSRIWAIGELSLDGVIRPYPLSVPILLAAAKRKVRGCILPDSCQGAASLVRECPVALFAHLRLVVEALQGSGLRFSHPSVSARSTSVISSYMIDEVKSQPTAKRGLEIALAGGHHVLIIGPPGVGKSMLARGAWELLPDLSREQQLEVAEIYALRQEPYDMLCYAPPFRMPHHTVSVPSLIGGMQPGEVSMAHHGLLFLDEFPEFSHGAREALRQPLQDGFVQLVKRSRTVRLPAQCMVIAALNPCPCGVAQVPGKVCKCTAADLARYDRALSQPLIDRFDICIHMDPIQFDKWDDEQASGHILRNHIAVARKVQQGLGLKSTTIASMSPPELDKLLCLDKEARELLIRSVSVLQLSARAMQKVHRVAVTIGLLRGGTMVCLSDVEEAIQYRYRGS